jgi:hypothetical protein
MVSECNAKEHKVKVVLSFGLVAVALLCALFVVVGERLAPRVERVLGIDERQADVPAGGINYDTLKNAPLNQMPVNEQAAREIKKQEIQVSNAAPPAPAPANTPSKVTPTPTARRYSIGLFAGVDSKSSQVLEWWNRDASLQQLKTNCNFQVYTKDNPLYRERYANIVSPDDFPAIVFSDPDGGHVYVAGKTQMPTSAAALYSAMQTAYKTQQQVREQSQDSSIVLQSGPDNCPDGSCRPIDRVPFINPERKPLFPALRPDGPPSVESILYWLWNPGEAVLALLCAALLVAIALVVTIKVWKS